MKKKANPCFFWLWIEYPCITEKSDPRAIKALSKIIKPLIWTGDGTDGKTSDVSVEVKSPEHGLRVAKRIAKMAKKWKFKATVKLLSFERTMIEKNGKWVEKLNKLARRPTRKRKAKRSK